jgi:hypothetical protein
MKIRLRLLFVFLILMFAKTTVFAQPKWFDSRKVGTVSKDEYFMGFGMANSMDDAISAAQNQLASQLTVTVKSETNLTKDDYSINDKAIFVETFRQEIQTKVNKSLTNTQIERQEKDDGTFYVLVVLNKEEYFTSLKRELDKDFDALTKLNTNFDRFINAGKWPQAFERLREAYLKTGVFEEKKSYFQSLALREYTQKAISPAEIKEKGIAVVSELNLSLNSGGDQRALDGEFLDNPIQLTLLYKDIPATGLTVDVSYSDGEQIGRYEADKNGIVVLESIVAKKLSDGNSNLIVMLSPGAFPEFARETLNQKKVIIPFVTLAGSDNIKESIPVYLAFSTPDKRSSSSIETSLMEVLNSKKSAAFSFSSDNTLSEKLIVTYSVSDKTEVEGMEKNLIVITLSVTLKSENTKTGKVYTSQTMKAAGMGANESAALSEAIKKVQISTSEMAKALRIFK